MTQVTYDVTHTPANDDEVEVRAMAASATPPPMVRAHERFLTRGEIGGGVRDVVAQSWRRSARIGVDPDHPAPPVDISAVDLRSLRRDHPLAIAVPLVRSIVLEPDAGWIAALVDAEGRLLWIDGNRTVRAAVERVGFVEGALWREDVAGTNAPGTALATGRPVQVLGAEHWSRPVQSLNCAAAPVHGPDGSVLGVLDITGGAAVGSGMARSLVRSAVAAVEAVLVGSAGRRRGTVGAPDVVAPPEGPDGPPQLQVLGGRGLLRTGDGSPAALTGRHAEILLLLAEHRGGLGAEELAVHLSGDELSTVAVRAEVSRLRRIAGDVVSQSRPYRVRDGVRTDVDVVRSALRVGDLPRALASYPGPVLPRSDAPGVVRVREDLESEMRAAVHASRDPGVITRWVASESGAEDWWAWDRLARVADPRSTAALRAAERLASVAAPAGQTSRNR
ncbi:helix-turn-helix domain-containing protein [Litorihabitans aurantiacus]|uniref:Transcriptional regulator n=1 Tax=Litorihabitans aurantiacus TaxID=1930061 RepID=A0AA38CTR3_9MICO|nr:helix-turn-helix domain-containing protein [Litorihabitans aurantiacus]GMA32067.1 transcriptional regulator [Litorihabitans aurantiacus]